MAYQLNASDLAIALKMTGMTDELAALEFVVSNAAIALAAKLGVTCDVDPGEYGLTQPGFGGLCIPFAPAFKGQPMPEALEELDSAEEWDWDDEVAS